MDKDSLVFQYQTLSGSLPVTKKNQIIHTLLILCFIIFYILSAVLLGITVNIYLVGFKERKEAAWWKSHFRATCKYLL